jgi:hypothetical protein
MCIEEQTGDVMLLAWYHGEVVFACFYGNVEKFIFLGSWTVLLGTFQIAYLRDRPS